MLVGTIAQAGTWSTQTRTAWPGQQVTIEVRFQGDGQTMGTNVDWRLDSSRLDIEAPVGMLSSANRAG
jgi:hypothetical protein